MQSNLPENQSVPMDTAQADRIPVICGPTAGGKSSLAIRLAMVLKDRFNRPAEIISADAFQVYRGLDIGTAKPTPLERQQLKHHLIDIVDPRTGRLLADQASASGAGDGDYTPFTVEQWLALANDCVADCQARGVVPIVVGGTHLYVKALLDGLFDGPEPDAALREALTAMSPQERRTELERVDPVAASRIHPNDIRRSVRALEVFRITGKPISAHQTQWEDPANNSPRPASKYFLIGLDWPVELLNRRINARVKAMLERGLIEEVAALVRSGSLGPQAAQAVGYKQLLPMLGGQLTPEEAIEQIKVDSRRLGKNQRTWLRRLRMTPGSLWIDVEQRPEEHWTDSIIGALGLMPHSATTSGRPGELPD